MLKPEIRQKGEWVDVTCTAVNRSRQEGSVDVEMSLYGDGVVGGSQVKTMRLSNSGSRMGVVKARFIFRASERGSSRVEATCELLP